MLISSEGLHVSSLDTAASETERSDSELSSSPVLDVSSIYTDTSSVINSNQSHLSSYKPSSKNTAKPSSDSFAASSGAASSKPAQTIKPISGETKAIWISQFDLGNVLVSGGKQRPQSEFTALFRKMVKNVKSYGFNTVFLQARPYSDSFYPSQYFPWSKMVTGAYGRTAGYDPYAIMVSELRGAGLSVHGWINPLRGMTDAELKQVSNQYPIRKWYNDAKKRAQNLVLNAGRWYYNSSSAEVRQLVADGARELLQKYRLDGIHIDDYFYYSNSLADVSDMVKRLYQAVKSVDSNAQFGVAPEGNVARDYSVHYADVRKWCSEKGYIDYICPQIYYGMEHETHAFDKIAKVWNYMITEESGVYLLTGMTLGKAGLADAYAGSGKKEWLNRHDILKRSLTAARKQKFYRGISLFSYQYLFDPLTGEKPERTKEEVDNLIPELKK